MVGSDDGGDGNIDVGIEVFSVVGRYSGNGVGSGRDGGNVIGSDGRSDVGTCLYCFQEKFIFCVSHVVMSMSVECL